MNNAYDIKLLKDVEKFIRKQNKETPANKFVFHYIVFWAL